MFRFCRESEHREHIALLLVQLYEETNLVFPISLILNLSLQNSVLELSNKMIMNKSGTPFFQYVAISRTYKLYKQVPTTTVVRPSLSTKTRAITWCVM